ncbi:MAG: hypothetical protein ABW252_23915 [Polyangiales bacterium]
MARGRAMGAALATLLSGCVFIDDFERFRADPRADAGGTDGAVEPGADGSTNDDAGRDAARSDAGNAGRDAGDAEAPRDADADAASDGTDAGTGPRDAGTPPTDAGSTPTDTGTPAPGCASTAIVPTRRCYPDRDDDRFADLTQPFILACSCPMGTLLIANASEAEGDCWDDPATGGADVKPGQTRFFSRGYGVGATAYDYDCNDRDEKETGVRQGSCGGLLGLLCADIQGFVRDTACGQQGEFTKCVGDNLNCQQEVPSTFPTQACR